MLINALRKHHHLIWKYERFAKLIITAVSIIFLVPSYSKNSLFSVESLFNIQRRNNILLENPVRFKPMMPNDTILIITDDVDEVNEKICFLKARSKYIKVVNKNLKGNYFLRIFLKIGNKEQLTIKVWEFQPLSDIIHIARAVFPYTFSFNIFDFENHWENRIYLEVPQNSYSDLYYFLKICSNFHSHYYGLYFTTPLNSHYISPVNMGIFNGIVILRLYLDFDPNINVSYLLIAWIVKTVEEKNRVLEKTKLTLTKAVFRGR